MAETTSAPKLPEALTRKIGPLPMWAWLLIGGGLLYYFHKKQAASSQNPAAAQSQTGYGTDPAGNTGYIDPQTGYVYGSAEDIAALQSQGQVATNSYNTGGGTSGTGSAGGTVDTSGQTTGGTTNPSGTSTSQPGTGQTPGTPSGGGAAPQSKNWQYPAPKGLAANSVTDSGFRLTWTGVQGPNGQKPGTYTVQTYQGNSKVDQFVSGSTSTAEYGAGGKGLKPSTTYAVNVWANGGPVAPPHASISVTTKPKGTKA